MRVRQNVHQKPGEEASWAVQRIKRQAADENIHGLMQGLLQTDCQNKDNISTVYYHVQEQTQTKEKISNWANVRK